ncbi:RKM5 [Candida jiufengensis]|uniref:RKM5 n=1 Tax=Candida jiufengensis TaxID=497108 RepID=UPI002224B235|nr:RKM5 [Candida jiufengensis]KAI5951310.1 RKM5 [Candida jiufengensis]
MNQWPLYNLNELSKDNIDDHIFELYSENTPPNNLGFIDKSRNNLLVTLPQSQMDLNINQSISQLSSKTSKNSTTGFICWQVSVLFADWLLSKGCPFRLNKELVVLELGSGIGGVCASSLSSKVGNFIATDQKHILKLLKENITSNCEFRSSTIEVSNKSSTIIDVIEFDWEELEQGMYNYGKVSDTLPNLVIACDTIYNEYLITPFINTLKTLLVGDAIALVAVQLRDAITLENFVTTLVNDQELKAFNVPKQCLSDELSVGFQVYCIKKAS